MAEGGAFRERLREIIFEAETPLGRSFDICLLWCIGLSVVAVMLESVEELHLKWGEQLLIIEWVFTGIFTIEYGLRLWTSRRPLRYARSFFGVVDLVSVLPSYIGLFVAGGHALMVVRILRLLRVFRVLKMARHVAGADVLMRALLASRAKITVFFTAVLTITLIAGTLMYMLEGSHMVDGERKGYTSIPIGVYWAIVTVTTLGFGDITPVTPIGQLLTSFLVLTGYAILAVPTGIVTAEMIGAEQGSSGSEACPSCGVHGHLPDAKYCRRCGGNLS